MILGYRCLTPILLSKLVRLRIAERPGVRRARQRMRVARKIPRLRPRMALRRAVAMDEARAARERVVDVKYHLKAKPILPGQHPMRPNKAAAIRKSEVATSTNART
jgi:hypothetical protein